MKIAIANWSNGLFGGVESYLDTLIPALSARGHSLAFFSEEGPANDRGEIALPADPSLNFNAGLRGVSQAIAALKAWKPDVIYVHQILDPDVEKLLSEVAPAVLFVHSYVGACISGRKTTSFPAMRPCHRVFGLKCLLHYYPHRCGGWNPVTMARLFAVQKQRSVHLRAYDLVLTQSEFMCREMSRYTGEAAPKTLPLPANFESLTPPVRTWRSGDPLRLLFMGRMEDLKGGGIFLEAFPILRQAFSAPIEATFAGDGTLRSDWERQSAMLERRLPEVSIRFSGWLDGAAKVEAYRSHDLLIVPSIWPEPFGLVGVEAGSLGLPAAAFDVGGIPEWLSDGISGHLAGADPPSAASLAAAIVRCFESPAHYQMLCAGARTVAGRHGLDLHVDRLLGFFSEVLAKVGTAPEVAF
ncbi:MAG: glycosyltransferase family 4 protein [Acidobacteriota bacterium]